MRRATQDEYTPSSIVIDACHIEGLIELLNLFFDVAYDVVSALLKVVGN
jgi:hypothetical protein